MADSNLSEREFLAHIGPIKEDIAMLVQLQRDQNSRVHSMDTRLAVLEDRSPGRIATVVSAVVAGVISGLSAWFGVHK